MANRIRAEGEVLHRSANPLARIRAKKAVAKIGIWARQWQLARQVLHDSLWRFFAEDSLMVSASIAYYSLLSIFPMLLLLVSLSGIYIRRYELSGRLAIVLEHYLPMKGDFIMRNLVTITHAFGRVTLASVLLLLWSSSGVFLPIEKALNRAWDVEKGRSWLRSRLLALELAVVLSFLMLVSAGLVGVNIHVHDWMRNKWFNTTSTWLDLLYHASFIVASFVMTLAMFVVLFERLPNRPMKISQVIPSAFLTAILWEGARSLFTLLLPRFNYYHVYGSIGIVVALMSWMYISSAVMLFGAQVSRALYRTLEGVPSLGAAANISAPQPANVLR